MNPRIKINYPWLIFWFFVNIYVDSVPLWDFLFSIVYFKNFLNFLDNRFGLGYNNLFDVQIFKIFTFLSKWYLLIIIYKIIIYWIWFKLTIFYKRLINKTIFNKIAFIQPYFMNSVFIQFFFKFNNKIWFTKCKFYKIWSINAYFIIYGQ